MTQKLLDCGAWSTTMAILAPSLQKRLTTGLTTGGNGYQTIRNICGQNQILKN